MGLRSWAKVVVLLLISVSLSAVEKLYVLNLLGNSVSAVNTENDAVLATITGLQRPFAGVYDITHQKCYVSNSLSTSPGLVTVIDTQTDTFLRTINVSNNPNIMAIAPELNKVFVINGNDDVVNVIDTTTDTVVNVSTGVVAPLFLAMQYVPSVRKVFIADANNNALSVIDAVTNAVQPTINLPLGTGSPRALSPSCNPNVIYASQGGVGGTEIIEIDVVNNLVGNQITVGAEFIPDPVSVFDCATAQPKFILGFRAATNTVKIFNATPPYALLQSIAGFSNPTFTSVLSAKNDYYVSNTVNNGQISVGSLTSPFAIHTLISLSPGVVRPFGFIFNTAGTKAYVFNTATTGDRIYVIDTGNLTAPVGSVLVGLEPAAGVLILEPPPPPTPPSPVSAPLPPSHLSGRQLVNTFLTQQARTNRITWDPPTSGSKPVEYRVFRNCALTQLAAVVRACQPLLFVDFPVRKNAVMCYVIVSVDDLGQVSDPASVCVSSQ